MATGDASRVLAPERGSSGVVAGADVGTRRRIRRRWIALLLLLLILAMLALLPPLVSLNRFQRRIATGISLSLGRPVRMDHVSLNLLPLPSLTIENLVVEEDPSFGSEPIIRSDSVTARLRVSSLWRRRIEFSRISFVDPSINLVHLPDGRWNIERVLLQASRIEAAPTTQRRPGAARRFPYIEATGARLNLKMGVEKLPFSLTDAEFALWLPEPKQWHLRLTAHPARTDENVSDTGLIQIEGTLGRPENLAEMPLHLQGSWRNVPMGEASLVVLGRDAGMRGEMTLTGEIAGTISSSAVKATVHVDGLRRADFVPEHPILVDIDCQATALHSFHTISRAQCSWPLGGTGSTLALTGGIPDVLHVEGAELQAGASAVPASTLAQWIRVASSRMPPSLILTGRMAGSVAHDPADGGAWDGKATIEGLSIASAGTGAEPIPFGEVTLRLVSSGRDAAGGGRPGVMLQMEPTTVALGSKQPALLDGSLDATGYRLHMSGMMMLPRMVALGAALPELGDGLAEALPVNRAAVPVRMDLVAERVWGQPQTWTEGGAGAARSVVPAPEAPPSNKRRGGLERQPKARPSH